MSEARERVTPHSLDAERGVLGAILIRPDVIFDVLEQVGVADFFRDAHQRIFRHMQALTEAHIVLDDLTLKDALDRAHDLDEIGGPAYLFGLTDGVPHSTHAVDYAKIVKEKSRLRQVIHAAQRTLAAAYDGEQQASDILDRAQATLAQIADGHVVGAGLVSANVLMPEVLAHLEALASDHRVVTGLPSGLTGVDHLLHGFQRKDLTVIGARPSMGKTALVMNIASHAIRVGKQVAVFSLEMSRLALGVRLLADAARIPHERLITGAIWGDAPWKRVSDAVCHLADSGLHIDDDSSPSVFDVRARARRLKNDRGLDLIIVDYLQLMRGTQRAENKNLEMAEISRSLKMIAKDLDVPVILLSQLSRGPDQRTDHRPQLSDLRDTGAIEQDADVVLLLYREEKYKATDTNAGVADIIVAKQRNGRTGSVQVAFDEEHMRFHDLDTAPRDAAPPMPTRLPYSDSSAADRMDFSDGGRA